MTRERGQDRDYEASASDLTKFKKTCFHCGAPQIRQVKTIITHTPYGDVTTARTRNFTSSCTNKNCFRYSDIKLTPSWIIESATPTLV